MNIVDFEKACQRMVDPKTTPANDAAPDRQFVTALARGLAILGCFSMKTPELTVSDIARMTGIPQPTVWRLCHTMRVGGFLVGAAGRDTIRPGLPLLGLGYAVLASQPLADLALPSMQRLADQYQGSVSLGGRDGTNMIYIQRCQGRAIILDMRVGAHVPIGFSATGWAFLAGLDDSEREAVILEVAAQDPDRWKSARLMFEAALERYRQTGYIITKGMLHPRINSVAVPVRGADGLQLLSLSSGGIDTEFSDETLGNLGQDLIGLATTLGASIAPGIFSGQRKGL